MTAKPLKASQKTQQNSCCVIETPVGKLSISTTNNKATKIEFLSPCVRMSATKNSTTNATEIKKYFNNPKIKLKLPIQITGTPLQQKIWRYLQKIPCGKTITYGELAQKIGTSPRVIGNACRKNPIQIIIPCHRVVAKTNLGGYSGKKNSHFLKIKKWLLEHESEK